LAGGVVSVIGIRIIIIIIIIIITIIIIIVIIIGELCKCVMFWKELVAMLSLKERR